MDTNISKIIRNMIHGLNEPVVLDNGTSVPAVNLDNAATTPAFIPVIEEIRDKLLRYGSIGRGKGQKSEIATDVYNAARDTVKNFVGANDDKYMVIFVNCTTDGMNKLASALIESPDDTVISTRMEHHANDLPWRERAKTLYADVDCDGRLKICDIERILKENNGKIKYVSVTAATNVMGYVNDVHKIAKIAHAHKAKIIVDGAQIIAHRAFNMLGTPGQDDDIDFFVFSAHKMYSPFGGGAIVGLKEALEKHIPVFYGGGMVDAVYDDKVFYTEPPDLYEAGSPNFPGVVGMAKAMGILQDIGFDYIEKHEQCLLKRAFEGLKALRCRGVVLYGDTEDFSDRVGIIGFNIRGIPNDEVADMLAGHSAIAVRHAAFCAHPYVRRLTREQPYEIGESEDYDHPVGMVRVSFGVYSTENDVDILIDTVKWIIDNRKVDKEVSANKMPFKAAHVQKRYAAQFRKGHRIPHDRG